MFEILKMERRASEVSEPPGRQSGFARQRLTSLLADQRRAARAVIGCRSFPQVWEFRTPKKGTVGGLAWSKRKH